jgi:hypothetical protein
LLVDAPPGVLTPELKAALADHKLRLVAMLARVDDRPGPAGPPVGEPPGPVGSDEPGPPPADRGWRQTVATWPVESRERWGRRANEIEAAGNAWAEAEWIAFNELAPDLADAGRRRGVVCADPPTDLNDPEAVAAIDRAFGDTAPARRSDRGPRRERGR